jgi:hypothetical protein
METIDVHRSLFITKYFTSMENNLSKYIHILIKEKLKI